MSIWKAIAVSAIGEFVGSVGAHAGEAIVDKYKKKFGEDVKYYGIAMEGKGYWDGEGWSEDPQEVQLYPQPDEDGSYEVSWIVLPSTKKAKRKK